MGGGVKSTYCDWHTRPKRPPTIRHNEPPRYLRRLQLLRRWSYELVEEVFPGGA